MSERSSAALAYELLRWCATQGAGIDARWTLNTPSVGTLDFLRSRELDSLYYLSSGRNDPWQDAYDLVWRHQAAALDEVLNALVADGVRALTFKGCELASRYFSGRGLGFMSDIDLLVGRAQIEGARAALYRLGFRHQFFDRESRTLRDRDVRDVAELELAHYELAPFVRALRPPPDAALERVGARHDHQPLFADAEGPLILIEVDVHHNVAADADCQPFFDRAVPRPVGVGETMCDADHLWFNLTRHYNEVAMHGRCSLRLFAYTIPLLAGGQVDWEVIEHAAAELALGPTLYYYLALCDRVLPGVVPARTLAAVAGSTTSRVRDWGWQLGKLFDFQETFPHYAFTAAGTAQGVDAHARTGPVQVAR